MSYSCPRDPITHLPISSTATNAAVIKMEPFYPKNRIYKSFKSGDYVDITDKIYKEKGLIEEEEEFKVNYGDESRKEEKKENPLLKSVDKKLRKSLNNKLISLNDNNMNKSNDVSKSIDLSKSDSKSNEKLEKDISIDSRKLSLDIPISIPNIKPIISQVDIEIEKLLTLKSKLLNNNNIDNTENIDKSSISNLMISVEQLDLTKSLNIENELNNNNNIIKIKAEANKSINLHKYESDKYSPQKPKVDQIDPFSNLNPFGDEKDIAIIVNGLDTGKFTADQLIKRFPTLLKSLNVSSLNNSTDPTTSTHSKVRSSIDRPSTATVRDTTPPKNIKSINKANDDINNKSTNKSLSTSRFFMRSSTELKNLTSISKRKFEEYIREVKQREQAEYNFKFVANPVPANVLIPMYDKMLAEQELRRSTNIKRASETLNASLSEFKFNESEEEKFPQFKANEIPQAVLDTFAKIGMSDEDRETERSERIKQRANELLQSSSLPPRMALYEENRSEEDIRTDEIFKKWNQDLTFTPQITASIPDFASQHKRYPVHALSPRPKTGRAVNGTENLKESRSNLNLTSEFKTSSSDHPALKSVDFENTTDNISTTSQVKLNKSVKEIKTTAKTLAMIKKRKEEDEVRQKKIKAASDEGLSKSSSQLEMDKIVQEKLRNTNSKRDEEIREHVKQRRLEAKRDEELYKEKLREITERARARPLLIEMDAQQKVAQAQRRKTLSSVKASLVVSGVDFRRFFNQDELDEIEEMELEEKVRNKH